MKPNKNRWKSRCRRALIVTLFLFFILSALGLGAVKSSAGRLTEEREKVYLNIDICENDSLWSIAEEYAPRYDCTTKEYVRLLKEVNHLSSERIITGGKLIVIYYK